MSCSDIKVQLLGDAADILVYVQQAQAAVSAAQQAEAAAQGSATQAAQSATAASGSAAAANAAQDTFNTSIVPYANAIEALEVNSITSLEATVDGSAKMVQLVFRSSAGIVFTYSLDLSAMFN